ncbi:MAG: hypothetical protein WA990_10080 [Rubrobacteraceae bacterium]
MEPAPKNLYRQRSDEDLEELLKWQAENKRFYENKSGGEESLASPLFYEPLKEYKNAGKI